MQRQRRRKRKAAKAADAAKEKEKLESVGRLLKRPSQIPRAAGGLHNILTTYLDGSLSKVQKQKHVPEEMQQMLSKMHSVTLDLYGREADAATGCSKI